MTFQSLLEKYRTYAFSERDKGARFEHLMQAWLKTDPLFKDRLSHVWMWEDFPGRKDFGGKDTGIDLVAKTHSGDWWAIQCKCFAEDATIDKPAVDGFLATSSRTFQDDQLQTVRFSNRLWISTTNRWGPNAQEAILHQVPPVHRVSLSDLEASPVDWAALEDGIHGSGARAPQKKLRPHQDKALKACLDHFTTADRGQLIMACGTGKTYTSLKIAEAYTQGKGLVLFLVPSIALLGQTLREWSAECSEPLNAVCVCSDAEVSKKKTKLEDQDSFRVEDLALPASTDTQVIARQLRQFQAGLGQPGMTVVFSTYQSIEAVAKAQKLLNAEKSDLATFDLVICDEAHRTTGATLVDEDEAAFVRVHDNEFLQARKRLYMTATPRLFSEDSKAKAKEEEVYLCSMDDPAVYGEEFYRIGFGEAVEKSLLSDYKVLVLTLSEDQIPQELQVAISDGSQEINTDDASRLIGCINALSKRMLLDAQLLMDSDPGPMRRAVAFCQSIKVSKKITSVFNTQKDLYYNSLNTETRDQLVTIESDHVDGSMGAALRDQKLTWLKSVPQDSNECRILTNVRCLSEGVDVPSLDAVLFLSARNSQIDVVQSVGRVMRVAPGKKYGYIIIPVVIPSNVTPEEALDDNDRFKVVWTVLNALRAHDDRFNAMVNKIDLNKKRPGAKDGGGTVLVGGVPRDEDPNRLSSEEISEAVQQQFAYQFDQLQNVIYARMVKKVGDKRYWEHWAASVGDIAQRHIDRIKALVSKPGDHRSAFDSFLADLKSNINPSVSSSEAVEMLAQHIITKPVFEALFENHAFVRKNPVSVAMQRMVDLLEEQSLDKDQETLQKFYDSVRVRVSGIDNAEGRQKIIVELYDKFFRTAFPMVVEKLGIVYTPVEVVDFLIHSVADVLQQEFDRNLSDENVHILDPFTGTGTFMTRLLQSGHIKAQDLPRKYRQELHANEIVLLAYYIASINIENVYHDQIPGDYESFPGICLTDTFQLAESKDGLLTALFPENSSRIDQQRKAPLRIILGNPPYSVGQKSANDNAQNQSYPKLESRIEETYAKGSSATSIKALYDSYIKAFRWASDRLDPVNGGIVAFVSNAGWLDTNGMDSFRTCLQEEFSSIYVFNLRGNQRTSGELSRREGGKIFGGGSRTPISITLLVKKPGTSGKATIRYHDIGDYLSREEKLAKIAGFRSVSNPAMTWTTLEPNQHGDWLNQRDDQFGNFIPLESDKKFNQRSKSFFQVYSLGVNTNRDSWVYNSSSQKLLTNIKTQIDFFNTQVEYVKNEKSKNPDVNEESIISYDPTKICWTSSLIPHLSRGNKAVFEIAKVLRSSYRPFFKQNLYFGDKMIHRRGQHEQFFPTPQHKNLVICVPGVGGSKDFIPIITDTLPDLELIGKSQCFPLYWYEKQEQDQTSLFDQSGADSYIRRDGITDFIWTLARDRYGPKVIKEDIFYYVYGFLHGKEYRTRYSADLKKMLPRLPLVEKPADFWAFSKTGRELAELHIGYESAQPYPLEEKGPATSLRVEKMRYPSKQDKTSIIYNNTLTLAGIPERAYEYEVNGKSALDWLVDRYQITTHPDSKITNDPNDWCEEVGNPRYIVDLVKRIVTVSLKTLDLVESLPHWEPEGLGVTRLSGYKIEELGQEAADAEEIE